MIGNDAPVKMPPARVPFARLTLESGALVALNPLHVISVFPCGADLVRVNVAQQHEHLLVRGTLSEVVWTLEAHSA